jgi:hypothetical protein
MARTFDGTNDEIRTALGSCNLTGLASIGALVKRNADGAWHNVVTLHNSGGSGSFLGLEISNTNGGVFATSAGFVGDGVTLTVADGWCLLVGTKVAGTSQVRWHKYVYSTNVWTHANSTSTVADGVAPGAGGTVRFGEWQDSDDLSGDLEVVGLWSRALSDAEVEPLAYSFANWIATGPSGLWRFNQASVGTPLLDVTGGGANETTITGTSVATSSVPIFNTGGDILPVTVSGGNVDLSLTPAVITLVAVTPEISITQVVALTPAVITLVAIAPAISVAAEETPTGTTGLGSLYLGQYGLTGSTGVELPLLVARIDLVAVTPTVTTGAVSLALTPAVVTLVAVTPAVSTTISLALTPATVTITAVTPAVTTGAVSLALTPAVVTVVAVTPSVTAGGAILALTPSVVTLVAVTPAVSATVTLAITPAVVTLTAVTPTVTPGAVSLALTPAVVTLVAIAPVVGTSSGPQTVPLSPAVVSLVAVTPAVTVGAVSLALSPAVVTLVAVTPTVTTGTVLAPTPAVISLVAVTPTITTGGVSVALTPGVIAIVAIAPQFGGGITSRILLNGSYAPIIFSDGSYIPTFVGNGSYVPIIELEGVTE